MIVVRLHNSWVWQALLVTLTLLHRTFLTPSYLCGQSSDRLLWFQEFWFLVLRMRGEEACCFVTCNNFKESWQHPLVNWFCIDFNPQLVILSSHFQVGWGASTRETVKKYGIKTLALCTMERKDAREAVLSEKGKYLIWNNQYIEWTVWLVRCPWSNRGQMPILCQSLTHPHNTGWHKGWHMCMVWWSHIVLINSICF